MKTRKTVPLSPRLDGKLDSYVNAARADFRSHQFLTATAIGVIGLGSLNLVPAVSAEIVYTPTNQTIGKSSSERGFFTTLQVDLNNDGVPDFVLSAYNLLSFSSGDHVRHFLDVHGLQGNQILDGNGNLVKAGILGSVIGSSKARFISGGVMADAISSFGYGGSLQTSFGYWLNAKNRYLGIKFYIDGEIHYGWARLNAYAGHATLTGYAYETIPDKPIPAGVFPTANPVSNAAPQKPATLGVLAMGAVRIR
jgi:hypothetical protein